MGIDRIGTSEISVTQEVLQSRLEMIKEMEEPGWFDKEENRQKKEDFFPKYNEAPITDLEYNNKVFGFVNEVYFGDTRKMKYWAENFLIKSWSTVENILTRGINNYGPDGNKTDELTGKTINLVNGVFASSCHDIFSETDQYRDMVTGSYIKHPEWLSFFLSEKAIVFDLNRDVYAYLYYRDNKYHDGSFTGLIKNKDWLDHHKHEIGITLNDMCEADNAGEAKWMSDFMLRAFGVDYMLADRITTPMERDNLSENMEMIFVWETEFPGFFAEVSKELMKDKSDLWWYSPKTLSEILASVIINKKEISMAQKCQEATSKQYDDKESIIFTRKMEMLGSNKVDSINKIINEFVSVLGIDQEIVDDCIKSWMTLGLNGLDTDEGSGKGRERLRKVVIKNVNNLAGLKKNVGVEGIRKLHDFYGITHFERYSAELLTNQLKDENKSSPYGIWLGSYSDYNGGFSNEWLLMMSFVSDAKDLGYKVKVVEARDKTSVVRRIIGLDRQFGKKNKIAFAVINGHGSPESVQLGSKNSDFLEMEDLNKESASKLRKCYADKVPFLFNACSTGQKIGPKYAEYGGSFSVAPDKPAYTKSVELRKDGDGNLYFVAKYGGENDPKAIVTKK